MGDTVAMRGVTLASSYELSSRNVQVNFATSGILGGPSLFYKDAGQQRRFGADDIRFQDTELGQLVTVILEAIPDLRTVTFTLIVPPVRVPEPHEGIAVKLAGILTTTHTTIFGPSLGAEKTYEVIHLEGKAEFIVT